MIFDDHDVGTQTIRGVAANMQQTAWWEGGSPAH
jgi:hypothetical protein